MSIISTAMLMYLHVFCCFDNSEVSAAIKIRLAQNYTAMSMGTSKLFLLAYTSYCSLTRMPEKHVCQLKLLCMDALHKLQVNKRFYIDCKSLLVSE